MDSSIVQFDTEGLKFDEKGLIPVIAQDAADGAVLMVAYMNKESLRLTIETGVATYWSRSRQKLWKKGETSGNVQRVKAIYKDCDADVLLMKIDQIGSAACHTGQRSCFFTQWDGKTGWKVISEPVVDPNKLYKK